MNEQTKELPIDPGEWTLDDCNEALHRIVQCEQQIASDSSTAERAIVRIKENFETMKETETARIRDLGADLNRAWAHIKKSVAPAQSVELSWGTIGQRQVTNVKFEKGLKTDDVIALAEKNGLYDVIKITKALLREALKAKGEEAMKKCGCYLASTKRFFIETKHDLAGDQRRTA